MLSKESYIDRAEEGFVNSGSARQSQIKAQRSERGNHNNTMADEKDRFGKVAASQNSQNLTELGITQLDLGFLVQRLVDRERWTLEDAIEAVRRYKNFLILVYKYPREPLAPAPDMDEAWHAHILFTQKYTVTCQEIFGGYLHHTPDEGPPSERQTMINAQQNTSRLYRKEFNEPYSLELDVSSFW